MNDLIVEEVRRVRDAYAARFNYDLDAIFRDIKEQEKKSGLKFVSFAPNRVEVNETVQLTAVVIPACHDAESLRSHLAAEH